MKRIIYTNNDGGVSIIVPTPEALVFMTIEEIAVKDVPDGLTYEIVETSAISSDRTFRGAWELDGKIIQVNNVKATDIAKNKLREWREPEFVKNDVTIQNALADDDAVSKDAAIARRTFLRDLPEQCDGKDVEELKVIVEEYSV
jgi:hypothetical protein